MYKNNPTSVLPVSVCVDATDLRGEIHRVVSGIVHGWQRLDAGDITISKMSGGNTNVLYKVDSPKLQESVVVRVFGIGTESFIDRAAENSALCQLSEAGIAPSFHGLFENGRIEGYIEGRDLHPEELPLPKVMSAVAKQLAALHRRPIRLIDSPNILERTKRLVQMMNDAGAERTTELMGVGIDTAEIASTFSSFEVLYSRIGTEASSEPVKNCSHFEDGKSFAFENVFCHNDALSCNIMIPFDFFESSEEKNIVLIDYEYAGYGCRAFDIANHFCEYCGFDFDFEKFFPSSCTRKDFIKLYLNAWASGSPQSAQSLAMIQDESFVAGFESIVLMNVLLSHLLWGTWAVVQDCLSESEFDFKSYALKRISAWSIHAREFELL